jgi:hypothetical protein
MELQMDHFGITRDNNAGTELWSLCIHATLMPVRYPNHHKTMPPNTDRDEILLFVTGRREKPTSHSHTETQQWNLRAPEWNIIGTGWNIAIHDICHYITFHFKLLLGSTELLLVENTRYSQITTSWSILTLFSASGSHSKRPSPTHTHWNKITFHITCDALTISGAVRFWRQWKVSELNWLNLHDNYLWDSLCRPTLRLKITCGFVLSVGEVLSLRAESRSQCYMHLKNAHINDDDDDNNNNTNNNSIQFTFIYVQT